MSNPRYAQQQSPREERLARLAMLAQIGAQQDAQDTHAQAAMVEQMKALYGLQQESQLAPERLQELRNKNLYEPQAAQSALDVNKAHVAASNAQAYNATQEGEFHRIAAEGLPSRGDLNKDRASDLEQKRRNARLIELQSYEYDQPKKLTPQEREWFIDGMPYGEILKTHTRPEDARTAPLNSAVPQAVTAIENPLNNPTPTQDGIQDDPFLMSGIARGAGLIPEVGGYMHNTGANVYDWLAKGFGSKDRATRVNPRATQNLIRSQMGLPPINDLPDFYKNQ